MSAKGLLGFTHQVSRAYGMCCEPIYQKYKLPRASFDILMFLANYPQLYTAKDIAVCKNIKPSVVSIHVDRLVKEGYLVRTAFPNDRRKIKLSYTSKADGLIRDGRAMQKEFYRRMTKGLSKEEIESFNHCFHVISQNAEKF